VIDVATRLDKSFLESALTSLAEARDSLQNAKNIKNYDDVLELAKQVQVIILEVRKEIVKLRV
jgi:hypothetical protein